MSPEIPGLSLLENEEQLDQIQQLSFDPSVKAVVIFKHSTRCGTSSMVLSRLERGWNLAESEVPFYFLDLIRYRSVSAAIAARWQVTHESPQLLVIYRGQCVFHASHNGIVADDVTMLVSRLGNS